MHLSSMMLSSFSILAVAITNVAAHGYVSSVTNSTGAKFETLNVWIGDEKYQSKPAVSRRYNKGDPVEDVTSPAIQCGNFNGDYAPPAALYVDAEAGTSVKFRWNDPNDSDPSHQWPPSHTGPVLTYLAKCPDDDCKTFEPGTDPVWFKIEEEGFYGTYGEIGGDTNLPDFAALNIAYGEAHNWETIIPAGVPTGSYIARHEIIALHSAGEEGNVQLYPTCHQLRISNGGDIEPTKDELVAFPGAYDSKDPGLLINIYYPKISEYTIPGPPLYSGAKSGNGTQPTAVEGVKAVETTSSTKATASKNNASISKNTAAPVKKVAAKASGRAGCAAKSSRLRMRW